MLINLIKSQQMFSVMLPEKINGQYWITDTDDTGSPRQFVSIEAVQNKWMLKSNKKVSIYDVEGRKCNNVELTASGYFYVDIENSNERAVLFVETIDETRNILTKINVVEPGVFTIGRETDNNFCYDNRFVTSVHAKLMYDGQGWSITDNQSKNGTYVNGYRVENKKLLPGDMIYIMGLKIVIGSNFIAINNPDEKVKIKSNSFTVYKPQKIDVSEEKIESFEKKYFSRSPRFHREIECEEIKIDPPPQLQKIDSVPLALMLGPSLTMGMASLSTGILSVMNILANGGEIAQALPTLLMAVSMLLGTVLWPILTKKYEKKQRIKNETNRQEKYLEYLNEISDNIRAVSEKQTEILLENACTQEECVERVIREKATLWDRVIGQNDFLRLRLGIGNLPMVANIKYQEKKFSMEDDTLQNAMLSLAETPKELNNVPIEISLMENVAVGIYGNKKNTDNMLKALILQMISLHSYDELKIMLVTEHNEANEWGFVKFIPHFWSNDKKVRFFATSSDDVKELSPYIETEILNRFENKSNDLEMSPYYVIVSTSNQIVKRCDALQNILKKKNNCGCTIMVVGENSNDFPKETKTVIHANGTESKLFHKEDTKSGEIRFNADIANERVLNNVSEKIANIELDFDDQSFAMPSMLTFLEMFKVGKVEHLNSLERWKENNPTKTLQTPVGVDAYGEIFNLDLHERFHGPHGLVAGMTGSGKSEFIITYILSLAVNYHPDEVAFILIDYKGGGLTGAFENKERRIKLPHLAGTITNLDGADIKRSLISIESELRRREKIFNQAKTLANEGTMDIYRYQQLYREKIVSEPLPHLFIISDEFAELKAQQPEFMAQLISTARIGRSLGVHLILATQKPSGVVDDQIWSNSRFRICLKVQEKSDSQDMIKRPDAAALSQTGRFYLQVGYNELFALGQSAWCGADYIPTDTFEKTIDSSIQIVDNLGHIIMGVKPDSKKIYEGVETKQIVSIVKYLSDLANIENISARSLWLESIPKHIYIDELERKYNYRDNGYTLNPVIGEYDDPYNQKQDMLTIPLSREGNCLVYGSNGMGKTTFITSLCYSLIKNHPAEELNLYIMDFGAETLKMFEKAPQVGGFMSLDDEEKIVNFLRMLKQEIEIRKDLFSEFGGDFESYCKSENKSLPNIVVTLNNYAGFAEAYEDYQDDIVYITREGAKYGIYFVITVSSVNEIRFRLKQNFKMLLTLQLNDETDYYSVVGATDGLTPTKCRGRGLVSLDRVVYEFQCAKCKKVDEQTEYIKQFCSKLAQEQTMRAKTIPLLPDKVNFSFVEPFIGNLNSVPVGVEKNSLSIATVNLKDRVIFPVLAQSLSETVNFSETLIKVLSKTTNLYVVDAENILPQLYKNVVKVDDYNVFVNEVFNEMLNRNSIYADSNCNPASLVGFEERVYILIGFKRIFNRLSKEAKENLNDMLINANKVYKMHFIILESQLDFEEFRRNEWCKKHISIFGGIWVGDGLKDQYVLQINKITSELRETLPINYGYLVSQGRTSCIKLLSEKSEKGEE